MRRRLTVTLTLAILVALVEGGTASAGRYDVSACDAAGGVNASWAPWKSHGGVAVYHRCPSRGLDDAGLVTRTSAHAANWTVPPGAAARWAFTAPPGAAVVGFRLGARLHSSDGWQAVIANGVQNILGCNAWNGQPGYWCSRTLSMSNYFSVPASASIYTDTHCVFGPCPVSWHPTFPGHVRARFIMYAATVTVEDFSPAHVVNPRGALWSSRWIGGRKTAAFDAVDNVGIREVQAMIDGRILRGASRDCDPAAVRCPDWPGATLDVPTYEVPDGAHTLTLAAVDRAGNVGTVSRRISIDNTAPGSPAGVAVAGGDGWRPNNAFSVAWTNPVQRHRAWIAGAHYTLCRMGTQPRQCVSGSKTGPAIARLDGITAPRAGDWELRVWLRDAAGNARPETAAPPVHLRYDPDVPNVALLPLDPEDPTQIRVAASDPTSGVARAEIEMRRRGAPTWRALTTRRSAQGFDATMPDARMPDGEYEIRARVFDAAGNERSTDRWSTGKPATVQLPVRVKTNMRVGKRRTVNARRSRSGRRRTRIIYMRRPRTDVGRRVRISGRLTAPGGNPLRGAPIEVTARPDLAGAAFRPVARLSTTRRGRFSYLVPPGPSRVVQFHYPGERKIRSQTRRVNVRVRATSTMRASRKRLVNGETVTFRGKLRGGWIPSIGKLVEVQFYARNRWRTFATTRSNARGRWHYEYRFDGTRGTVRWRFRARIPSEAGYPFTPGASRRVNVTVRGV